MDIGSKDITQTSFISGEMTPIDWSKTKIIYKDRGFDTMTFDSKYYAKTEE